MILSKSKLFIRPTNPIIFLFLVLFLILGLSACNNSQPEQRKPATPGVLVVKVISQDIRPTSEFIGRTFAVNDVSLQAQVSGYLKQRSFEEGKDVEAGAPLFLIDPAPYKAEVAAAEGRVAEAKAAVTRTRKDLKRALRLVKKGNISQQERDKRESDKLQAEAQLKSAEAALQQANINLSYTQISSPIHGRIGRAIISVGNLVGPLSGELARIVELDPIYVNFSVDEKTIIALKNRDKDTDDKEKLAISLRLADGSLYDQPGKIDFIDNVVDYKTGSVTVRVHFENPDKLLLPGFFVTTILSRDESIAKLLIPQASVQEDQAGQFVMLVTPENTVEQRRISANHHYQGQLIVDEGLKADETIIVEGIQKVRPGMTVKPRTASQPNTRAAQPGL
ncbi:RND efflux system, membrane fusion protein [hydrothermal vent metagenome]|uniref:RND efflux system, membrane fusion protein n=1 Tax=hydrothermal vent metagenome TaxID=652676 RepID=A0A3B1BF25_9ZZZZ